MKTLNNPFIFLVALVLLVWLGAYSYPTQGYSVSQIEAVNSISGSGMTLSQRQAAALKEIYHLTDAEISAPVNLWRAK